MTEEKVVKVFKALANPTRLKMVRDLQHCPNSEERCSELSAKSMLSQPTLSHHFRRLIEADIIHEAKFGTKKSYRLNHKLLENIGIDHNKL